MSAPASIASSVTEGEVLPGLNLATMPMGLKDVVTIGGSFLGGDVFNGADNQAVSDVTVAMLDKGTQKRDKFEIGAALEAVGASVSFSSDDYRINFSARCLKENVALVIEILAEQLRYPAFHDDDLESLQKRAQGNLQRQLENTDERARIAFSQALYPEGHPNYTHDIEQQMKDVAALTTGDLKQFHETHFGLGSMLMVATGDLDRDVLEESLKKHFSDWKTVSIEAPSLENLRASTNGSGGKEVVTMPDKTSVDLMLGMAIGIDREHPDFRPLMMASFILGGNFSARLMATVRDKSGLTYGIGSSAAGAGDGKDGYWAIHGTFSPDLLQQGITATLEQFDKWLDEGSTAQELAAKITTITGSYQVGLASTRGMAGAIMDALERGKPISYLDDYPDEIRAVTLKQVNGAMKKYISRDRLTTIFAGSVDEKGEPLA